MSQPATISISHSAAQLADHYILASLARIWQSEGFRIEVGPSYSADAEICILHHDRTWLDPASVPAPPTGVRPINGAVLDISKRLYSTLRLQPSDTWSGGVIVKTNLNAMGVPERVPRKNGLMTKLRRRLRHISWRHARMLPRDTYPILNSIREVPDWVWADPELIVEKFIPERADGNLYSVRGWLFLGDKGYGYRLFSHDPIVKTGNMVRYEYLDSVPDELMTWRTKLGFDFGKFDYVEHEGKPILLDANKTPTYGTTRDSPRVRLLASGIEAFR